MFENYVGPLPAVQAYCNLQMSQRVLLLVGGQLVLPQRVPCNASGHQKTQFEKLHYTNMNLPVSELHVNIGKYAYKV